MAKRSKTPKPEPACPECARARAIKDKSQIVGEFLNWLQTEKKVHLCTIHEHTEDCKKWRGGVYRIVCDFHDSQYVPFSYGVEKLLADYFKIDLNKMEDEKRALLDYIRQNT
jgi:hypothetical protein